MMFDHSRQDEIVSRLTSAWQDDDRVGLAWIEGSLAEGRGNPASDIDIRVVVANQGDYLKLLDSIAPYHISVMDNQTHSVGEIEFIRVITADGIVIDFDIYDSVSEIRVPRHKVIVNELDIGHLRETQPLPPNELWPADPMPDLKKMTVDLCVVMASVPTMFYNNNPESAMFQLDLVRAEVVKMMYRLAGVKHFSRYKYFRELFHENWLEKLSLTYPTSAQPHAIARSYVYTYRILGEFLELLSNKSGGGFIADFYWRVYGKMCKDLEGF